MRSDSLHHVVTVHGAFRCGGAAGRDKALPGNCDQAHSRWPGTDKPQHMTPAREAENIKAMTIANRPDMRLISLNKKCRMQ